MIKFKLIHYISVLVIFSAFLTLLVIIYLMTWPPNPLVANQQPYTTVTKQVKPGENFIYETNACKYITTLAVVQRTVVIGNANYILQDPNGYISIGCTKSNIVVPLPRGLPLGTAYLKLQVTYHINFLRTVQYQLRTEDFQIVK